MNLSNWNPFKFARKKSEEKKVQVRKERAQSSFNPMGPQAAMQQFFNDPFYSMPNLFGAPLSETRWFGDYSPSTFQPSVDVTDEGKALRISAELPGMSESDIELSVDTGALTIKGEKATDATAEENGCYRTERAYGYFQRVVPLPVNVSLEGIEANFDKGVLTVRVPKSEEATPSGRQIAIGGQ